MHPCEVAASPWLIINKGLTLVKINVLIDYIQFGISRKFSWVNQLPDRNMKTYISELE